jgi:putative membrane protein
MKLHPFTIPYRAVTSSVRIAWVAVIALVTGAASDFGMGRTVFVAGLAAAVLALAFGWQLAYYRRFDYELTGDTFDIRSGVLSRREREIPLTRVQNVDLSQNPIQQFLNIAEVRLETAGASETEAHLRYVSRAEADRLQDEISRLKRRATAESGADGEVDETDAEQLYAMSGRELAVLGLTSLDFRLVTLLAVGLSTVIPAVGTVLFPDVTLLLAFGPLPGILLLIGLGVLNGVSAVARYYGSRLSRSGDQLQYERGLFQRYTGTIPLGKVQHLELEERLFARWLGYAALRVQTAGSGPGESSSGGRAALVPIATRERALSLARSIEPFGDLDFERPPRRARLRYAARYTIAVAVLTGLAWGIDALFGLGAPWYLAAAPVVLVPVAAHLKWRNRGYLVGEEYVVTLNGFWSRSTVVVAYDRVQTVITSETVFQRRRDLGTLTVDTAGAVSRLGVDASAVDLDAAEAHRLRDVVNDRFRRAVARRSTAPDKRPEPRTGTGTGTETGTRTGDGNATGDGSASDPTDAAGDPTADG